MELTRQENPIGLLKCCMPWERHQVEWTKACKELARVKDLSAFNVQGYVKKWKTNQHLTRYCFDDGSSLYIFSTNQRAQTRLKGFGMRMADLNINK